MIAKTLQGPRTRRASMLRSVDPTTHDPAAGKGSSATRRRSIGWPLMFSLVVAALLVSNGFWLYQTLDSAVGRAYSDDHQRQTCEALKQALGVLPRIARSTPQAAVVAAARDASSTKDEPFRKDGQTVVGSLAFTFSPSGALVRVETSWEPLGCP
jgi:hypothetical protein